MSKSLAMTASERNAGELETQLAIQDTLLTLRVLNKFNRYKMIEERIVVEQAKLNDLWTSGDDKYNRDIHGNKC